MSKIFNSLLKVAVKREAPPVSVSTGCIVWYRDGFDTVVMIGLDADQAITFRRSGNSVIHVTTTCRALYVPTNPLNEAQLLVVRKFIESFLSKSAEDIRTVVLYLENSTKDHDGQVT